LGTLFAIAKKCSLSLFYLNLGYENVTVMDYLAISVFMVVLRRVTR